MRKSLVIISAIILVLSVYSLIPVAMLYLSSDPPLYSNSQAIDRLKMHDGNYFKFIALGDNHAGFIYDDSATLKEVRHINREDRFKSKVPVDFVIIAGDLTFDKGTPWQYRIFNRIRSMIKYPVICAVGNHDGNMRRNKELFKQYVGDKEFSFTNRNCYFVILDNAINDLSNAQFSWLEEELKRSAPYAHRFVIMHKSPLSPYQQSWFRPELSKWAYRFMKLCEKYKVDMVITGHEHMFRDMVHGGVRYITSGGGGMLTTFPSWDGGYLHYLSVRVYGDYVDYEVRKVFPPFWEYVTYYIWKDLFYFLKDVVF